MMGQWGTSDSPNLSGSRSARHRAALSAGPGVLRGPTLPGADDWVVYGRGDAEVVRLELGEGRMTRTAVPELGTSGTVSFLATRTGVLARPVRAVPGYQVPEDEPAAALPPALGRGGVVAPGAP